MNYRVSTFVVVVFLSCFQAAFAETTIGRWCDEMIPTVPEHNTVLEIVITQTGSPELRSKPANGSPYSKELDEQSGGIYLEIDSHTGDRYRIVPSTGNLQLIDNDGIIRVARRLENRPKPDEC